MKADYVEIRGMNFVNVTKCSIKKKVNQHGYAVFSGIIEENYEESCLLLATAQQYIEIWAKEIKGEEKCMFVGYIDNLEIDSRDIKTVTVTLCTGSGLLDMTERTRTFQNAGMTYKQVLRSNERYNSDVGAASIYLENADKSITDLLVQYKETDWEFAKRIASINHTFIRPAFTVEGSKYFFGLQKGQAAKEKPASFFRYKVMKRNTEYEKCQKKNEITLSPEDSFSYYFSSRDILEVGDCVSLNSKQLYVYKVEAKYDGEEVVNRYELRTANGFSKMRIYNTKLIGASLNGTIQKVTKDRVELLADVDAPYPDHGAREFLYSTVYSSPDGTGWYCMPEIGDCIRLYFPSEREKDAYAISSVHLDVSGSQGAQSGSSLPAPRTDPNYKSFKNPKGKEIIFSPSSISIINPDVGSIILDDSTGITITSEKSIRFKAQDFVEMHSTTSSLELNAGTKVTLEQGENVKFGLDDNIGLSGGKMRLQE